MDFGMLAEKWIDDHDEIVEMEADEIARKAFLAGVEAAQQSAYPMSPTTDEASMVCSECGDMRGVPIYDNCRECGTRWHQRFGRAE